MGSVNLYKIDYVNALLSDISNKKWQGCPKNVKFYNDNEIKTCQCTLYTSLKKEEKELNWNWILEQFNIDPISVDTAPEAVLLIIKGSNTYAVTFGCAYLLVDKYCDRDFAFQYARKIDFDKIKTTAFITPNSHRNKTVNTYINYNNLELDSGESFIKLKVKDTSNLFKSDLEVGTSIRFTIEDNTLDNIIHIITHIEKTITNDNKVKHNIPLFSRIKDKKRIDTLERRLLTSVKKNHDINFSELEIIGTTEVFNNNDGNYTFKYKHKRKENIPSLDVNAINSFCKEMELDYASVVLDITVESFNENKNVVSNKIRNIIDYTDDKEKCILSRGNWYQYNDDYLKYLHESIAEIEAIYDKRYNFTSSVYNDFIESMMSNARTSGEYKGQTDDQIREALKHKYYTELAFNSIMECKYGFKKHDRETVKFGDAMVEPMDLYKDKTMFAVKIGNSSAKLCYAIDQSLTSLRKYKEHKPKDKIDSVAIWLILEKHKSINKKDGLPDLNKLKMLMLKNRLDQWKKEVRLQGLKPIVYINYKRD